MIPHTVHLIDGQLLFQVLGVEKWMTVEEFHQWVSENEMPASEGAENGHELKGF